MNGLNRREPDHPDYDQLQQLITQIREGKNKDALAALDELREKGWLSEGALSDADLSGADLSDANLSISYLSNAKLRDANLKNANLWSSVVMDSNFSRTNMWRADLCGTELIEVDLYSAYLRGARLSGANLRDVNLDFADLRGAKLRDVQLTGCSLSNAIFLGTELINVSLSNVTGLDEIRHLGPSIVDYQTLTNLQGRLPIEFLRGVGLSETSIKHLPSLFKEHSQFHKAFISYSHVDKDFADRLYSRLRGVGVLCWQDDKDMRIGDIIDDAIDQGISSQDKVIVCCSKTSMKSRWVLREFEKARLKEKRYKQQTGVFESVLLPVDIDGCILHEPTSDDMVLEFRLRYTADFTNWKDHDTFEAAFEKLVKALKIHRPADPEPKPGRDDG